MYKKYVLGMMLITLKASAAYTVDMFGDDSVRGKKILEKYQASLIDLEQKKMTLLEKQPENVSEQEKQSLKKEMSDLYDTIKQEGDYLYVNDEVVVYPGNDMRYITLEVIQKRDGYRMDWVNPSNYEGVPNDEKPPHDIIQAMIDYDDIGTRLLIKNQLDLADLDCPRYHCTFGFKHPDLKRFRIQFDEAQEKYRDIIIKGLSEKNPQRRAAAVFLVGEFHSPKMIFDTLLPHVNDIDPIVRNNVVRVLGDTMLRSKDYHIDVRPFIHLLHSPFETDRNKALAVLWAATHVKEQRVIIKEYGKPVLEALAKLKQPNNHDFAQMILEKIS